jgi:ABC-type dipeptide/oligopeptide/nickel transport system permease subunit
MNSKKKSLYAYSALLLAILLLSLVPEFFTGKSPYAITFTGAVPPGKEHLLGTDFLGRDILARTLIGGRVSIVIGVLARLGSVLIGLAVGILAGLGGRMARGTINAVVEVFLSIPSLLLALALVMVLGEGFSTVIIAIVAGTWAPVARFIAVRVAELRHEDFITAARALGARESRVAVVHIIPSLFPLLLPLVTTGIATSIMLESTLSFLGLGGGASLGDLPSWGMMIQEGSRFIFDAPWIIIPPSVMLSALILCFNQIGDKLAE